MKELLKFLVEREFRMLTKHRNWITDPRRDPDNESILGHKDKEHLPVSASYGLLSLEFLDSYLILWNPNWSPGPHPMTGVAERRVLLSDKWLSD